VGRFQRKYTAEQEAAIAFARSERGMTAPAIAEQARLGLLELDDQLLEPFEIPAATVSTIARRVQKRAMGEAPSDLAAVAHRTAIEILRQRMVSAADHLSRDFERTLRVSPGKADPERGRQIVRMIREAAALPAPDHPLPPRPRSTDEGGNTEGATKGGLAAQIEAAHMRSRGYRQQPALPPPPEPEAEPDPVAAFQAGLAAQLAEIEAREAAEREAAERAAPVRHAPTATAGPDDGGSASDR
jgi:hypothetical protein